jgi:DNA adenine methylase
MPQNMNLITRNTNDGALNASKKPASREWLQDTRRKTPTDIQQAARFYYLQKNCFGAKLEGQSFGTATTTSPGLNLLRLEETLSAAHLRLAGTFVERLDWKACID